MINPQALQLNETIETDNSDIFSMLSTKGQHIFFPKSGILAQAAQAKGLKYNATIGVALEEDGSPMALKSVTESLNISKADSLLYAPSYGLPELRQKWRDLIYQKNPSIKNQISLPVVANGLTHALSILAYLFFEPNDSVILPDKFWGNYKLIFSAAHNAKLDYYPTFTDTGFNTAALKSKLLDTPVGKKIVLLNCPNNPTGYTPTNEEAEEITNILLTAAEQGNNIITIFDDAYFGLVYKDGIYQESLFSKIANLHQKILAVKVDGATKEDYAWGIRTAFITYSYKNMSPAAAKALEDKTAGAIRGNISNAPKISQSILLKALNSPTYTTEKTEKYQILRSRFAEIQTILEEPKYQEFFTPLPHNSGYFMCIKLREDLNAEEIRQILLQNYQTGLIAINDLLRVSYSSVSQNDLKIIFENIYSACQEATNN